MVQHIVHTEDPAKLRRDKAPEPQEQLEALWDILAADSKLGPATLADPTYQKVKALKVKFPKPPAGTVIASGPKPKPPAPPSTGKLKK